MPLCQKLHTFQADVIGPTLQADFIGLVRTQDTFLRWRGLIVAVHVAPLTFIVSMDAPKVSD